MKKLDFKGNKTVRLITILFAMCIVIALIASTALKLSSATYILKNRRNAAANAPIAVQGDSTTGNNNAPVVTPSPVVPVSPDTTAATTKAADTTAPSSDTGKTTAASDTTTQPSSTTTTQPSSTTDTTKPAETTTQPTTDSPAQIKEKKSVLATYNKIVNNTKTKKAGFTRAEYRTLEKDTISGILFRNIESSFPNYFVSKADAEKSPTVIAKKGDVTSFGINNKYFASLLSENDASKAIKSVSKTSQKDGSTKITIVLRDEENPAATSATAKKASSYTGAMFNVLDGAKVKSELASTLKISSVNSVSLGYTDCTVELVYSAKSGKIISLTQTSKCKCKVNVAFGSVIPSDCTGTITDTAVYTNFIY